METLPVMVLLLVLIAFAIPINKKLEVIVEQLQSIALHFNDQKESKK